MTEEGDLLKIMASLATTEVLAGTVAKADQNLKCPKMFELQGCFLDQIRSSHFIPIQTDHPVSDVQHQCHYNNLYEVWV